MTERLIVLLGSKLYDLSEKKEKEEKAIEEIKQLKEIIKSIESNPFNLCMLEEQQANYIVEALSLGKDYFDKVKKYKVIYDGFLKFGRDAIPQIEIVENFIEETKKALNDRKFDLSDEVANHQHTIVEFEELGTLHGELMDKDKPISKIELLFKFLESSSLEVEERNKILLEINERNNAFFEKNLQQEEEIVEASKEEEEVVEESEYEKMISELQDGLAKEFSPATLNHLKSVSELVSSCKTKEEFDTIFENWKFPFGDTSVTIIINGLIDLKKIELLTVMEIVEEEQFASDNLEEWKNELETINLQIQFLKEYQKDVLEVKKIEDKSIAVDTSLGKIEQALIEYNDNPLDTPTCVLIINEAVDRDIKSITDKKTLEDVFMALEQFKNGTVDKTKLMGAKDLEIIGTKSKGHEARVACVKLGDNIYGVINITDIKDESPRNWLKTLESRKKSSDIDTLRKTINDSEVLSYYVARTKDISGKLKNRVASLHEEKVSSGGAK